MELYLERRADLVRFFTVRLRSVAAALGISRSAVEKHMMAALKHLLARLP